MTTKGDPPRFLRATDVAARLGVSRSRAFELIREMPRLKLGRSVRVSEAALEEWIKSNTIAPRAPLVAPYVSRSRARAGTPEGSGGALIRPIVPRTKPRK